MKIVSIYKHLQPRKWYSDLFDKITKEQADRLEERVRSLSTNPTEKQLLDLQKLLEEKGKTRFTHQEVWESNHNLMGFFSIGVGFGYEKLREKDRVKTIKEWRLRDKKKDERVLTAKPFSDIKCPVCGQEMEYRWSELYDRGTYKKPDEQVMFFYECPSKCKRKLIFKDGTPWITKTQNTCPVCKAKRTTTVTKDKDGHMFLIHECLNCGSRQVEKDSD